MLVLGISYHVQFMLGLRRLRESMRQEGLVHGETGFPVSFTLITALILLLIGVAAIVSHGVSGRTIRIGERMALRLERSFRARSLGSAGIRRCI